MKLSVVIVNYNVKYYLENTIRSVLESANGFQTEIIVVDNASSDGSENYIKKHFPDVKYIYNQENAGFAKANNQGLKIAVGEYILILNPDTLLMPDTVRVMIDYLSTHHDTAMVSCKVTQPDGRLDNGCRRTFPTAWNSFSHITGLSKFFPKSPLFSAYNLLYLPEDEIAEVDAISGCFMFFKREILERGIYLPEEYFMYGEDLDFCYQIKKSGFKIEYVPLTSIIHYRGQSSRKDRVKLRKHFYQSMNIFVRKNYSSRYSIFFQTILDTGIFLAYLISIAALITKTLLLPIIDLFSFFFAVLAANRLYPLVMDFLDLPLKSELVKIDNYLLISPIYLLVFFSVFFARHNYRDNKYSFRDFITSSALIGLISVSITYFLKDFAYSRIMLMLILTIAPLIMLIWRYLLFKKTGFFLLRTLVVGIDKISQEAVSDAKLLNKEGLYACGFIDTTEQFLGKNIGKYPVYGNIQNVRDVLKLEKVECVIISAKSLGLAQTTELANLLEQKKISYKILPDLFMLKKNRIQFMEIR